MMTEPKATGLYLHIPFCRHLCGYCAFAKTDKGAFSEEVQTQYIEALKKEWKLHQKHIDPNLITSLYLGGGTPSRLTKLNIDHLFQFLKSNLPFHQIQEITFEINPEDLVQSPDMLRQLQDHQVNRVSMGIQTFQQKGIDVLERKTSPSQNLKALQLLTQHFKGRISLDFILAWPGQTLKDLESDLSLLKDFPVGHLSTYIINYEPGTRLERDRKKGLVKDLEDDLVADLWERFQAEMSDRGYEHYEISSFCHPQQESRHNIKTWQGEPYLGLGSGAVSRIGQRRWTNHKNIDRYMQLCQNHQDPFAEEEEITKDVAWQEELILGLRHKGGLNLKHFHSKHGLNFYQILQKSLKKGLEEKDWIIEKDSLIMTPKGWQLFDHWLSEWMIELEQA